MRIALLSYRSKDHCGGQGVYVRHLSRGLVDLGHDVEVFSGQPYPELLDPRVRLTKVPSLDLYREPDPFRVPHPREIRDSIDLLELLTVWTAGFPEPRTFTLRTARMVALGVIEQYRRAGVAEALVLRQFEAGFNTGECSMTLEDNVMVNRFIEAVGAKRYKTFRIYAKSLP